MDGTELSPTHFPSKLWRAYVNAPLNFSSLTGWRYPGLPRLKGNPLMGRLSSFFKVNGPLNDFIAAGKLAKEHELGMSYFWLGFQPVLFVTKPKHIKQVLIENKQNISSQIPLKLFKVFFGSSIFVDSEELFEKKKAIYIKWLNKKILMENYETSIKSAIQHYVKSLLSDPNKAHNLHDINRKFTLHVVLKSTMQFLPVNDQAINSISAYLDKIDDKIFSVKNFFKWNLPSLIRKLIATDSNPEELKQELRCEFSQMILDNNEDKIKNMDNFLKDIWELNDKQLTSLQTSFNDIFGDANAALIAGVETASSTLQFIIKILAAYPDVERKLHTELTEKLQTSTNGELSIMDIYQLPYLDSIIKETLRIYTPAVAVLRTVTNSFAIDNIPVFPGDMVIFSPFVTHRLPEIWGNDVEAFNPDRFMVEDKEKTDAFVPFSKGPHACIGRDLALLEIKALIATLVLNFKMSTDHDNFELSLQKGSLKPKLPTYGRFIPR